MSLNDKFKSKPPTSIGQIELVLNDMDGAPLNMSARGMAVLTAADGDLVSTRYGDPHAFMPMAWRLKVKEVLDELRAELMIKVL